MVELSWAVVLAPSEDTVDSDRSDVVVELQGSAVGDPSVETVDSD